MVAPPTVNGDWIRTIIGAVSAVAVTVGGIYTVVIVPQTARIEKLEAGREKDRDQLAQLYLSIQTNDEYKKTVVATIAAIRSDIAKVETHINSVDEEQKRRTSSVTSVASLEKRIDRIEQRSEENERRFNATHTIGDELKDLRTELSNLRQRIMVPLNTKPP